MAAVERDLRWSHKYPELGQSPVPVEPCISPEFYAREIEKVFKRVWLKVGRVEELPDPGSFKLKRLDFAKTGVLLVRGKDKVIRAFHNVCSHRGNKVVWSEAEETFGRKSVFTCHFHGWGYNERGELAAVPEENRFPPCFKRAENGLTPIHCDVWQGFIFVNLSEQPTKTLTQYLGGIGEYYAGFPFHKMTHVVSYHTHMKCNWKIGVDAFSEAYHVRTIHAGSAPGTVGELESPQLFGDHRTAAICFTPPRVQPPLATLALEKARASLNRVVAQRMLPPKMNPERLQNYGFEMSVFFPNLLVHVTEGIWFTHQFWPTAPDRCYWEGHYYVEKPRTHTQRWAVEYSTCQQRNLWLEDTATMEGTHAALESKAKKVLVLQDSEILIRHGYHVLDKYMREA